MPCTKKSNGKWGIGTGPGVFPKKERISLTKALNEAIREHPDISILTIAPHISTLCNISIQEAIEAEKIALEKLTKFPDQFQIKGSKKNQ